MGDMNEIFHLSGNLLVLRYLLNINFKTGVKKSTFKKIAEMLSGLGVVFKFMFYSLLNIIIISVLIELIGSRTSVGHLYNTFQLKWIKAFLALKICGSL